jgi:hypothetical protein
MFAGLDDDLLKQALLTAYAGEDPKILEEMQDEHRKNMEAILADMEIKKVEDLIVAKEEQKSQDNVTTDGDNTSITAVN